MSEWNWRSYWLKRVHPWYHLFPTFKGIRAACGLTLHPLLSGRLHKGFISGLEGYTLLPEDERCPACVECAVRTMALEVSDALPTDS